MSANVIGRVGRAALGALVLVMAAVGHAASPHHTHNAARETAHGLHGMLLFGGRDGLFASHLPIFHAPHDAQVVLRITLEDAALEQSLRDALARRPAVWTLVPQRFDLLRLAPEAEAPLTSFTADIVEGHFERGGTPRHRAVRVRVIAVPVFRRLDAAARSTPRVTYQRIAAGDAVGEQFLVLRIDARPGADHVLAVRRGAVRLPDRLDVDADSEDGLSASERSIAASLAAHDATLRASLYRETGDLR